MYMPALYDTLDDNYVRFEGHDINILIDHNNVPWFNANEMGVALGYSYPKDAISNNIDDDDKIKLEDINTDIEIDKHPHSIYTNESGLYSLMIISRLPKAKKFKK